MRVASAQSTIGCVRRVVATVVIAVGLWLAVLPFVSVWSSTSEALDVLPSIGADEPVDDRKWDAMFSPGFVVATRVYQGTELSSYRDALVADGFESALLAGEPWWMKECCGDYDYVQVGIDEPKSGGTLVTVSLYDSDVQATWFFISGLGLLLVVVALGVRSGGSGTRTKELVGAE